MSFNNPASAPTAQEIEDEILNSLTSAHVTASTLGETMRVIKDAVLTNMTVDSLMDRLRGATTGQTFSTGGGLSLGFDNALVTLTASQESETIPATGESDNGMLNLVQRVVDTDNLQVSSDSGTTYAKVKVVSENTTVWRNVGESHLILGIGNSTGRYKIVSDAVAGTRIFQRMITTSS